MFDPVNLTAKNAESRKKMSETEYLDWYDSRRSKHWAEYGVYTSVI